MPTKSKRLEWAESALDELGVGIANYAERNPVAAQRMLKEINHAAVSISQARMSLENCLPLVESLIATEVPSKGRPGRLAGTRELVVGSRTPYILVFAEVKHPRPAIQILRVIAHWAISLLTPFARYAHRQKVSLAMSPLTPHPAIKAPVAI